MANPLREVVSVQRFASGWWLGLSCGHHVARNTGAFTLERQPKRARCPKCGKRWKSRGAVTAFDPGTVTPEE